jgi:hypothetical protein
MEQNTEKKILYPVEGRDGAWMFWCPGCGHAHCYYTGAQERESHRWQFDGNTQKPTFSPSLLCRWNEGEPPIEKRCHLFVRNGMIEYCGDSSHSLAGKTIPMEAF